MHASRRTDVVPTAPRTPLKGVEVCALALVVVLAFASVSCSKHKSESELANEALQLGLKAHAEGHLAEAQADYRTVLVHDPQNKFAYYNLGLIDQTSGNTQGAEGNYDQALAIDPNFVPALYNLAIVKTTSDPKDARQLYERAISLQPDDAAAHLNLGFLLIGRGQPKKGKAELVTALGLDPSLSSRVPARYLQATQGPATPTASVSASPPGSPTASSSG